MKSRVSEIRVKQIRVNQGVGIKLIDLNESRIPAGKEDGLRILVATMSHEI